MDSSLNPDIHTIASMLQNPRGLFSLSGYNIGLVTIHITLSDFPILHTLSIDFRYSSICTCMENVYMLLKYLAAFAQVN